VGELITIPLPVAGTPYQIESESLLATIIDAILDGESPSITVAGIWQ
jgi:hypothetical protein